MCWDGRRWVDDDTLHVFDLSRRICRAASAECGDAKERVAIRIAAAQTVEQLRGLRERTVVTPQESSNGTRIPGF